MPIYEYECYKHGRFSELRVYSKRTDPFYCPTCGKNCLNVMGLIARTSSKWGDTGKSLGSTLDSIQKKNKGNVSDKIHERHSGGKKSVSKRKA